MIEFASVPLRRELGARFENSSTARKFGRVYLRAVFEGSLRASRQAERMNGPISRAQAGGQQSRETCTP